VDRTKFLIDTNVFIGLEDNHAVNPNASKLAQLCQKHSIDIYVHEATKDDIRRDRNLKRRNISESKLAKYQSIENPKGRLPDSLGPIRNAHDQVDVALLFALDIGAVDFLITEDRGIHTRAGRKNGLANQVLTIADAKAWVESNFAKTPIVLPHIESCAAHQIPKDDEIFESLREGYPDFDEWWKKCIGQHRQCWAAYIDDKLAGLIVYKDEAPDNTDAILDGDKILKLCTFKVKPEYRGEKLGEQLLKMAFWFAQLNGYDLVYVTTFEEQQTLIRLLEFYGFKLTYTKENREGVYEKFFSRKPLPPASHKTPLDHSRTNYPRFSLSGNLKAFCIPIQGQFHRTLFPEISFGNELPLLPELSLTPLEIYSKSSGGRTPGNTIRKVYISRSKIKKMSPADVLLFYLSKDDSLKYSQTITSVGVLERVSYVDDLESLIKLVAKRSVYSNTQLQGIMDQSNGHLLVLDFLLINHFSNPIELHTAVETKLFNSRPPQSIAEIEDINVCKELINSHDLGVVV